MTIEGPCNSVAFHVSYGRGTRVSSYRQSLSKSGTTWSRWVSRVGDCQSDRDSVGISNPRVKNLLLFT